MASNHVGHFIYSLRDRVWPDFVCHFSLFKSHVDYSFEDNDWHLDNEIREVSARSPVAINSSLCFLENGARVDHSSSVELAKFGFLKLKNAHGTTNLNKDISDHGSKDLIQVSSSVIPTVQVVNPNEASMNSSMICFGSFPKPNSMQFLEVANSQYTGSKFKRDYWQNIPDDTLYHILDLWQAGYPDPHVQAALSLKSVPSTDFIYEKLKRCEICSRLGHAASDCTDSPRTSCKQTNCTCQFHAHSSQAIDLSIYCTKCLSAGHVRSKCSIGLRCRVCSGLGHLGRNCPTFIKGKGTKWVWRIKQSTHGETADTSYRAKLFSAVNGMDKGKQMFWSRQKRKQIWRIKQVPGKNKVILEQVTPASRSGKQIWRIKQNPRLQVETIYTKLPADTPPWIRRFLAS